MRLKAFSFLEVLVAIVISGIVISTAYSVYIYSGKQFFRFKTIKAGITDYFEFTSTLNRDFEAANKVVKKSDYEMEMQLAKKNINYQFESNYILRTINLNTDTFFFFVENVEYTTLNQLSNEPVIDYLKLTIKDNSIAYYKDYGAVAKIEE